MCQYLYFCTIKASKLRTSDPAREGGGSATRQASEALRRLQRQYLYFCTIKASKLST
jgi:hypothetical protein